VSSSIIFNSEKYKNGVLLLIGMAVLAFVLNYILVPIYGLIGAAIATTLATAIHAILRVLIVYVKFKILPYSINTVKTGILLVVIFGISLFSPSLPAFYSILLKVIFVVVSFTYLAYKFRLIDDFLLSQIRLLLGRSKK
jgi:O-antigen/teichoic acid export membrane protein